MHPRSTAARPARSLLAAALIALPGGVGAQAVWTPSDLASSGRVYGVAHGAAGFVAVTANGAIYRSADGASWTNSIPPSGTFLQGVAAVGDAFYAVGQSGTILRSPDATTWTPQDTPTAAFLDAVAAFGKSICVVGGAGTVLTSSDGEKWSSVSSGSSAFLSGVAFGGGQLVAVGDSGAIIVSGDGQSWSPASSGTSKFLSDVEYCDGLFVAVGQEGTVLTSDDATTWTVRSSGTPNWLFDVARGNGEFIAVGDAGTVLRSPDAMSWSPAPSGTGSDLTTAAFGSGRFIAAGAAGAGGGSLSSPADPERPSVSFALRDILFEEGASGGSLSIEIIRSGDLASAAAVSAAAFGIDAQAGDDFTLGSVPVEFGSGQAMATLAIAVPDDAVREPIEFFVVELRSPSTGVVLGELPVVCVRIHDPGDSDGDFLPDSWELAHFFDLTSNSAGDDPDGDGNDNLREFEDGTDPTSEASIQYRINVSGGGASYFLLPDAPAYAPGSLVAVGALEDEGFTFVRWEGDVFGDPTDNPMFVMTDADLEIRSVLSTSLENALDLPGVDWSTTGAALWSGQTLTADDGTDAAQAGAIGAGGVSELFATVTGPGTLSFRWRSMFDEPGDLGRFVLGGVPVASVAGDTEWATVAIALPPGEIELRFIFQRGAASAASGAFWVDTVAFEPLAAGSYEAWRAAEFDANEAADDAISGPGADPDGDGIENGAEYLFGLAPRQADAGSVEYSIAPVAGGMEIAFSTVKERLPFVSLALEGSDDLENWPDLGAEFVTVAEDMTRRTLAAFHATTGLPRQLYRLGIEIVSSP